MSDVFRAGLVSSGIREELDLVDRIRRLLVHEDIPLPGIVVVGNTSVGKSSVLESISGVEFPKGSALTTTCPNRLRLRDGSAFTAKVDGIAISDKSLIGRHIDAAMKKSRPAASRPTSGHNFTGTVVEVELEEPGLPDVTLLDLPGITNSGHGKEFISNLVQEHIRCKVCSAFCFCHWGKSNPSSSGETFALARVPYMAALQVRRM